MDALLARYNTSQSRQLIQQMPWLSPGDTVTVHPLNALPPFLKPLVKMWDNSRMFYVVTHSPNNPRVFPTSHLLTYEGRGEFEPDLIFTHCIDTATPADAVGCTVDIVWADEAGMINHDGALPALLMELADHVGSIQAAMVEML